MSQKDDNFKIIFLGEAGVGKSSLIRRYTNGTFASRTTTTVGVDRIPTKISVDNEELHFQVLDTAGSIGFRGLIKSYMTNIDAVVFMYDISNKETFACLPLWTSLLKSAGKENLTKVLVGNKRDLSADKRQVQFKNAKNYAEFEGMISMEISVKQEESVDLVFQCIARELKLKKQLADAQALEKQLDSRSRLSSKQQDFIEYDDTNGKASPPRQFARKLSYMLPGRKGKARQQMLDQQQRRESTATTGYLSTMRHVRSNTELRRSATVDYQSEKSYLMW